MLTLEKIETKIKEMVGGGQEAAESKAAEGEVALGSVDQIPHGEGRVFPVNGVEVAVFHTRAGQVYAVQAECPHRQGPLADGLLGGTTLICPFHARKFDLATGTGLQGDCNLQTYPVRLDACGDVWLTV